MHAIPRLARAVLVTAIVATAGCSNSGGTAKTVTPGPTPTPVPSATPTVAPAGNIFVANQGNSSVTVYNSTGLGTPNQAPVATIAGSNTGLNAPDAIAVDAAGNIYVCNLFTITVYPPNPTGTLNEAPTATINVGGHNGGVTLYGMGLDATGKIYAAYPGTIEVYAANPTGTVTTPIGTIAGSNVKLAEVHNIAVDAAGRIYASDNVWGIVVYPPNPVGTVNEAPVAQIPRDATTTLNYPWGLKLDASGKIYTSDSGRVLVFAANPVGTVDNAPLATIAGSNTTLDGGNDPLGLDPAGNIFVTNESANTVVEFAANPTGTLNEAPIGSIAGAATVLNSPRGVAVR